ncbi:hypothetical protein NDU88_010142 [Pleurodeles waltl]|uniref:Uncharacterized protein n=1 Tax=Pleurodeles waltl TaxID=8319 RepID=A0AAV7QZK5_PLEWA|nr:hypothetical protein NDU88_010142 [Pleurodeles waltl]
MAENRGQGQRAGTAPKNKGQHQEERPTGNVSAHQKKGLWRAIAKEVRTLVVYGRQIINCWKRWEEMRHWARKTAEAQLGMACQRGRSAHRTLTSLMACILVVAYPELDGHLRESQQPQGGEYSGYHYKFWLVYPLSLSPPFLFCHPVLVCISIIWQRSRGTGDRGSSIPQAPGGRGEHHGRDWRGQTDSDTSSDGSSLVVADTSVTTPAAGTAATPVPAPPSQ